jgi:hypothetical protein
MLPFAFRYCEAWLSPFQYQNMTKNRIGVIFGIAIGLSLATNVPPYTSGHG